MSKKQQPTQTAPTTQEKPKKPRAPRKKAQDTPQQPAVTEPQVIVTDNTIIIQLPDLPINEADNAAETESQEVSMNKSEMMRRMFDSGMSITQIAKELGVRYNFVYNVLTRYKDNAVETQPARQASKSQQIRNLFDEGKGIAQIRTELGLDYAFVYGVVKNYRIQKEREAKA